MFDSNTARILLFFLLIADGVTTYIGMAFYGVKEANPIMGTLINIFGIDAVCIGSRAVAFLFLAYSINFGDKLNRPLWALVAVLLCVQFNNLFVIMKRLQRFS